MMSYSEGHLCPLVGLRSGKFEDPRRMRHLETPLTSAAAETDPSRAGTRHLVPGYLRSVPPGRVVLIPKG
jgi:hypothetical protein